MVRKSGIEMRVSESRNRPKLLPCFHADLQEAYEEGRKNDLMMMIKGKENRAARDLTAQLIFNGGRRNSLLPARDLASPKSNRRVCLLIALPCCIISISTSLYLHIA